MKHHAQCKKCYDICKKCSTKCKAMCKPSKKLKGGTTPEYGFLNKFTSKNFMRLQHESGRLKRKLTIDEIKSAWGWKNLTPAQITFLTTLSSEQFGRLREVKERSSNNNTFSKLENVEFQGIIFIKKMKK